MTVRAILITLVLILSQAALAQIVTRVNAVETSPASLILPADTAGMMTFRACDGASDCDGIDYTRVQLTASTRFTVNGETVKYADFRRKFAVIRRAQRGYALVTYETATNQVKKLDIAG